MFLNNLREDYSTRFGNFNLYYNFLTNSLKFITLSEREFHKEDNRDVDFSQKKKIPIFEKITKKTFFDNFCQNRLEKN